MKSGAEAGLGVGVGGEVFETPGYCGGGGFVAGEDEAEELWW